MKALFFIWTLLLPAMNSIAQASFASEKTSCANYVAIYGKTNVNDFNLQQVVTDGYICGPGQSNWNLDPENENYEIRIPVRNFTANNKFVYDDFLDLLKAGIHPNIIVSLSQEQLEAFYNGNTAANARIGITVAGRTNYYRVPCIIQPCSDQSLVVRGIQELKLTDFKLTPPKKTLGLIRVQDQLIINFEFRLPPSLIKTETI